MINLLPPDYAMKIRYGRRNAGLLRWLAGAMLAIAGLGLIILSGWLLFNHQSGTLNGQIASAHAQLEAQNLVQVQKDADQISGDIKIINQVLSREINFSDLMQQIGKVMPPGSILGGLTLSKVNGSIDLTASAKDYTTAAQVAVNLSDPKNGLFAGVDIVNINCTSQSTNYRCSASLKALFSKDTQNKFLNVPSGAKQ